MLKKIVLFGGLLWLLMFAIVSIFVGFGIYNVWTEIVTAIIGGVITFILAGYVQPHKVTEVFKIGFSWIIISLFLDSLITMRFNSAILTRWTLWVGYALVLFVPFLRLKRMPGVVKPKPEPQPIQRIFR